MTDEIQPLFEDENKKYDSPEESLPDRLHALAKAVAGLFPGAGTAAEFVAMLYPTPYQRRQVDWMGVVASGLRELDRKVEGFSIDKLKNDERFVSALFTATQSAMRTHLQDKREALRNAVLNVAVGSNVTEDIEAWFLLMIDRYTPWHLRVLRLFQSPLEVAAQKGITPETLTISGSLTVVLEACYPDLKGKRSFYDVVCKDLYADGMLNIDSLHGGISQQGMFQKRTTEWGDSFVKFISAPL